MSNTHISNFVACLECRITRHEIWHVHPVFVARSVCAIGSTAILRWHIIITLPFLSCPTLLAGPGNWL